MIFYKISKKKIITYMIISLFMGIVIFLLPHFVNTDYYSDKEMAYSVVQGLTYEEGVLASAIYKNPFYWIYNIACQLWGLFITCISLLLIFNGLILLRNKKYFEISKKICIYIWINISYFLWADLVVEASMNDLQKEVLDSCHDSMGIPYIRMWLCMFLFH